MENLAEAETLFNRLFGRITKVIISQGARFVNFVVWYEHGRSRKPPGKDVCATATRLEERLSVLDSGSGYVKRTNKKAVCNVPCDHFHVAHGSDLCFIGLGIKAYLSTLRCSKTLVLGGVKATKRLSGS